MSSRVTVDVARETPSSCPTRTRCALVLPSVSRTSCALGWAPGAPGRGRPNSGSSMRRSCSKLGGNCIQAEGPTGTLSTLLTCQHRAGPRRPRGGARGFMTRPPGCARRQRLPSAIGPSSRVPPRLGPLSPQGSCHPWKENKVIDSGSRPICRSPGSLTFEPHAQASPGHLTLSAVTPGLTTSPNAQTPPALRSQPALPWSSTPLSLSPVPAQAPHLGSVRSSFQVWGTPSLSPHSLF